MNKTLQNVFQMSTVTMLTVLMQWSIHMK